LKNVRTLGNKGIENVEKERKILLLLDYRSP